MSILPVMVPTGEYEGEGRLLRDLETVLEVVNTGSVLPKDFMRVYQGPGSSGRMDGNARTVALGGLVVSQRKCSLLIKCTGRTSIRCPPCPFAPYEWFYPARFLIFSSSRIMETPIKIWPMPAIPEMEASTPRLNSAPQTCASPLIRKPRPVRFSPAW